MKLGKMILISAVGAVATALLVWSRMNRRVEESDDVEHETAKKWRPLLSLKHNRVANRIQTHHKNGHILHGQ